MSTQIDLGPVLSVPKGDWNASTTYERLNLVRHNSAAWICNVDTSIGVEPSEDSVDWFLQVKDTSAVSSVNGMRGDVEITTIQTPSKDSDDISITNTEWVRDRIAETINSTYSYTDSAISTATTSILSTAAQDASNKATIAVNQALAASEAKFAAKEIVNNLADNVSTLTENDAAQDEAIDGKLDKSGGTMTGSLTLSQFTFTPGVDTSYIFAQPDDVWANGARIQLNPGSLGGDLTLIAAKDGTGTGFYVKPGDGAYVDSGKVITSAGGTMVGAFVNATIIRNNLSGQTEIYGGTTGSNGAYIALYGQSCTEGYGDGKVLLRAANKGTKTDVTIDPGVGMYVDGKKVMYLTAEWRSGNDWYRKYSDGWIEQGGEMWVSGVATHTIPLNTPFSHTVYTAVISQAVLGSSGGEWVNGQSITSRATTSFNVYDVHSGGHTILWYACGN